MPRGINSSSVVEQWANNLPLTIRLASLLPPRIEDVAKLTSEQVDEISKIFSSDLKDILKNSCAALKTAVENVDSGKKSNSKFGTYEGNFGKISDFHKVVYDDIGNPNPQWEWAMRREHTMSTDRFTTGNYGLETCPSDEWDFVVHGVPPPPGAMGNGRILHTLDHYMSMEITSQAGLTRPEVISLVLYTGPMYMIWNTILRKYPSDRYKALQEKDGLFPTSIFVLISAIQKISRVMVLKPGQSLYRGVDGNMNMPEYFSAPDGHGCVGVMELGFMSTTTDLSVAVSYSGVNQGKAHPKVFEIRIGSVDRGADIHEFSQYPGEAEYLWAPHAFLEPIGGDELVVTEHGVVQLIKVRANSNLKAVTLEEYEVRKKELHMSSFKILLQDLQRDLDEWVNCSEKPENNELATNCISQCEEVRNRHRDKPPSEFNDDSVYRGLVTEMLDTKTHAMVKMDYLMSRARTRSLSAYLSQPLRMAFRDRMGELMVCLRKRPNTELALDLCKRYGLVTKHVSETNELGEPPLITACADGVADDMLELLLSAKCDVNAKMSYPGIWRKDMTALLTAALYGRTSSVQLLADHGADVGAVDGKGQSALWFAAYNGHIACVTLLRQLGADVSKPNNDGWTPLIIAANGGHAKMVKVLVGLGAEVDAVGSDGSTALRAAARANHPGTVETLSDLGADVNRADDRGATPMYTAAENGHQRVVEVLARLGADVNIATQDGATPLYAAARNGHADMVELLLGLGADGGVACGGSTAVEVAEAKGHTSVVEVLLAAGVAPTHANMIWGTRR